MKYKMVMLKERFDVLNEKMSDRVVLIKEEIEKGDHWFHFEIELKDQFDMLDFFHAGFSAGYERRAKLFQF